jgi:hypothetical protein
VNIEIFGASAPSISKRLGIILAKFEVLELCKKTKTLLLDEVNQQPI